MILKLRSKDKKINQAKAQKKNDSMKNTQKVAKKEAMLTFSAHASTGTVFNIRPYMYMAHYTRFADFTICVV